MAPIYLGKRVVPSSLRYIENLAYRLAILCDLMDLEENSDLSTFMKTFLEEGAETAVELWTSLDEITVATNAATQRVLRC